MNFLDVVATGHDDGRIRIALAGSHLSILSRVRSLRAGR